MSENVTVEDYEILLPELDEAIAAHDRINVLVLMEDFDGWVGLDALKADYQLGTHQYRKVDKAAFVSDKKWLEWVVKIMDPFTRRTDEKFFEPEQLVDSWQWVKSDK